MYHYYTFFLLALLVAPSYSANAVAFSPNLSYTTLYLSYSAYCTESLVQSWTCTYCTANSSATSGFHLYEIFSNSAENVFGYVGYIGTTVYVVFRGTSTDLNWLEDVDALLVGFLNLAGVKVHQGFWDDYSVVQSTVTTAVLNLIPAIGATGVVFTGHSLGGALAELAAFDIGPQTGKTVQLYTFGSPRVGNPAYATTLPSVVPTSWRITNQADIVIHLPQIDLGFQHPTQEVWYSTSTKYQICSATNGEDNSCSDGVLLPISTSEHTHYLNIALNSC